MPRVGPAAMMERGAGLSSRIGAGSVRAAPVITFPLGAAAEKLLMSRCPTAPSVLNVVSVAARLNRTARVKANLVTVTRFQLVSHSTHRRAQRKGADRE